MPRNKVHSQRGDRGEVGHEQVHVRRPALGDFVPQRGYVRLGRCGLLKDAQDRSEAAVFEHDRIHPVVHPLLQDMLGFVPPEPPRTVLDLVDAWTGEHSMTV